MKLYYTYSKFVFPIFKSYNFHPIIQQTLEKQELHTASAVQDLLFTNPNRNRLLIGPTGTGKTLAYLLPILNDLKNQEDQNKLKLTQTKRIRSLIVVPSKELVSQVTEVAKSFTKPLKLSCTGLGIMRFPLEQDLLQNQGVDLAISTLERLQKHRTKDDIYLSQANHFVIDEIDTLLDSGNSLKLQYLCEYFLQRENRIITLCGATNSRRVKKFVEQVFGKDISLLIDKNVHMHLQNLTHEFIHCTSLDKSEPLLTLFKKLTDKNVLIFCNSIKSVHFLQYFFANQGYKSSALHSDLPRPLRNQNINEFRSQRTKILIATDLAARGLDFPFLDVVINFDFPESTSDYLHRAGRTGRAGKKGQVYSLYHNKEKDIIDELREANETNREIRIGESAYSKMNREDKRDVQNKRRQTQNNYNNNNNNNSKRIKKLRIKGYKPKSQANKQERTRRKSYFEKQLERE